MEKELNLQEKVLELVANKKAIELKELFETVPEIDIAEALDEIDDVAILLYIFRVVSGEHTAEFFSFLTTDQQELIINSFGDKQIIDLLENSFTDDIVDTLEEMPANVVTRILKVADKDLRKDINFLLNYKENTAGAVMSTEYVDMLNTTTVKSALAQIRSKGKDAVSVFTIFIRDRKRTLLGTIDLDDLIFAEEDEKLGEIMHRDLITCNVNDDQEEVADKFRRYDLTSLAVTNSEGKMCGIITVDDAVDILVEEAAEDISLLNQVSSIEESYLKTPVFTLVKKCLPWIIVLMVLQIFSTLILSGFQNFIAQFAILSVFTPLLMDAGGNSGGQTTTLIIRSIALNEFDKGDFKKVLWKELRVSTIIGLIVSIFAFGWLMFEMSVGIVKCDASNAPFYSGGNDWIVRLTVAGLVATSLLVTIIFARLIGACLPFLAKAIKKDPAVMCGPLTTTIVDIIALISYFLLWAFVFGPMLGFTF